MIKRIVLIFLVLAPLLAAYVYENLAKANPVAQFSSWDFENIVYNILFGLSLISSILLLKSNMRGVKIFAVIFIVINIIFLMFVYLNFNVTLPVVG